MRHAWVEGQYSMLSIGFYDLCLSLLHTQMQMHAESKWRHNKDERHSSLEKYASRFIWKGSKGLLKVLQWEGVGNRTKLQHIDPHSYGHNSVSFPFSWAAQPGAWGTCSSFQHLLSNWFELHLLNRGSWGPPLLGAGFLCRILSPTRLNSNSSELQLVWTSCAPSYIIVRRLPSSCGCHKSHSFNLSTVKVIFWYSSTGCTCYLHRCISYFDSLAGGQYATSPRIAKAWR